MAEDHSGTDEFLPGVEPGIGQANQFSDVILETIAAIDPGRLRIAFRHFAWGLKKRAYDTAVLAGIETPGKSIVVSDDEIEPVEFNAIRSKLEGMSGTTWTQERFDAALAIYAQRYF